MLSRNAESSLEHAASVLRVVGAWKRAGCVLCSSAAVSRTWKVSARACSAAALMQTFKCEEERSVVAGACGVSADWDCGSIAGPVDGGSAAPRSAAWTKEDGGCACRVRLRVRDGHGHPARAAYALTHRIGEESCLRPRHPLARQPLPLDMLQDVVAAFMGLQLDDCGAQVGEEVADDPDMAGLRRGRSCR